MNSHKHARLTRAGRALLIDSAHPLQLARVGTCARPHESSVQRQAKTNPCLVIFAIVECQVGATIQHSIDVHPEKQRETTP